MKLSGIVHATVELKIEMRNVVVCKLAVFIRTVLFVGMVFPLVVRSSHVRGSPPELVLYPSVRIMICNSVLISVILSVYISMVRTD